jgi:hypothetical protein
MQEAGRSYPKSQQFQMYMELDKEKPGIGNIRGLNLATVKSTTVQVPDCRFWG